MSVTAETEAAGIFMTIKVVKIIHWVVAIACMIVAMEFGNLILKKLLLPAESQGAWLQGKDYGSLFVTYAWLLFVSLVGIWLATGLRRLRRWIRPIGTCLFALFTYKGIINSIFIVLFVNVIEQSFVDARFDPDAIWSVMRPVVIAMYVLMCLVVLSGAVLFSFYRSTALKTTLENRDFANYWTDPMPMPLVLGTMLFAELALGNAIRLFRVDLTIYKLELSGIVKVMILVGAIALLSYLAWGFARRRLAAWYVALLAAPLWLATEFSSGFVMPDSLAAQAAQLAKQGFDLNSTVERLIPIINWMVLLEFSFFVVYLLAVKRYFGGVKTGTSLPSRSLATSSLKIYAKPTLTKSGSKQLVWMGCLAGLGLISHSYTMLSALLLSVILITYVALLPLALPAFIFRERDFSLPLATAPLTEHYAYADLKVVHLWSAVPTGIRLEPADRGTLNLFATNLTPADLARVKKAFVTRGLQVTEMPAPGT